MPRLRLPSSISILLSYPTRSPPIASQATTRVSQLIYTSRPHRTIHTTAPKSANPLPITAAGPPPAPPEPVSTENEEREERRQRVREAIQDAQQGHGGAMGKVGGGGSVSSDLKKRFWKEVEVQTAEDGCYTINLDNRAVRAPLTKVPLVIPASKPHLATAIAAEWDALSSAQQALKPHLVPLTALAARAIDLEAADHARKRKGNAHKDSTANIGPKGEDRGGREEVIEMLMRHLETDTLLCLEPAKDSQNDVATAAHDFASQFQARSPSQSSDSQLRTTLRDLQLSTLKSILTFLTNDLWPGVTIRPVLDGASLVPASQPPQTLAVIRSWLVSLSAWELAGLERAVLAGKSFCVGARLIAEWSEGGAGVRNKKPSFKQEEDQDVAAQEKKGGNMAFGGRVDSGEGMREGLGTRRMGGSGRFGIDEAAAACSLEVRWQTGQWGEVEDSHDVEREDLRRQMGSAVLLVSGTGTSKGQN